MTAKAIEVATRSTWPQISVRLAVVAQDENAGVYAKCGGEFHMPAE